MRPPLIVPTPVPELRGSRVVLRDRRDSDVDDRLRYPIDPDEEDLYGGSWRRQWNGQLFHTREHLAKQREVSPGHLVWTVEHDGRAIGSAGLRVDVGNHRASYFVGLFAPELRGLGLGRETTRLVVDWGFGHLGLHRVELQVLTTNERAIRCYEAVGFRREGIRRESELYPEGWKDFLCMGLLATEWS